MGGSSRIAFFTSIQRSSRGSRSTARSFKSSAFISCNIYKSAGSISRELLKAVRSLGLADPYAIFVISRSKSYTGDRYSLISSREIACSFNSCTASRRRIISVLSISGCSTYFLNVRAPIAVFVLSRTHRRDPLFCFSRRVSQSSRFLLVELSIIINLPAA